MAYTVKLFWDPDAAVWVATSEDIPGLVLESGSFDALVERVRFAAPGEDRRLMAEYEKAVREILAQHLPMLV